MGAVTTEFLNELQNLSKEEKSVIRKFQTDPTGASFVPVAELLRKRGYIEEAIVVLEDGVQNYPQYSSARASLARDYYSQGMFDEALKASEAVLTTTPDNALAQRINLKILVLLDKREEALARLKNIARAVPDDALTLAIRKALAVNDWPSAQRWVRSDLEKLGVYADLELATGHPSPELSHPHDETAEPTGFPSREAPSWAVPTEQLGSDRQQGGHGGSGHTRVGSGAEVRPGGGPEEPWTTTHSTERVQQNLKEQRSKSAEPQSKQGSSLPEALRSGASLGHTEGDVDRYLLLRGFRRIETRGFFVGRDQRTSRFAGLERQTIAEIYRAQGLQIKALEIYEKLIREEPNNLHFQQNYQQLKRELRQNLLRDDPQVEVEDATAKEAHEAMQTLPPASSTEDTNLKRRMAKAESPAALTSLRTPASQQHIREALRVKGEPHAQREKSSTAESMLNQSPHPEASASSIDQPAEEMVATSQRKIQILKGILGKLDNTKDDPR